MMAPKIKPREFIPAPHFVPGSVKSLGMFDFCIVLSVTLNGSNTTLA
jgi:hypothetical protein